uniref:Amine oxidase n=1 Tax=Clastoptera arizonana TaxID=38151 RepID=A0A1B6C6M6_9HEMI
MTLFRSIRFCTRYIQNHILDYNVKKCKREFSFTTRSDNNKFDLCPQPVFENDISPADSKSNIKSKSKDAKVVIIGAGMAGLAAANCLQKSGMHNYVIIEALDRPGGRIFSNWLGDTVVELGAQWADSCRKPNPILQLAVRDGLVKPPLNKTDPSRGLFLRSDGTEMNLPLSLAAYEKFKRIWKDANTLMERESENCSQSVLHSMAVPIQQELKLFPKSQREDAARLFYGLINVTTNRSTKDKYLLVNNHTGSYIKIPGGLIKVPLGYMGILSPMLHEIPHEKIIYGKPVYNIIWGNASSTTPKALVKCSDGDEFPADYVLITIPLGVLQASAHRMFCPGLPTKKMNAIRTLCTGHVNKMFLEFEKPFWLWWNIKNKLSWENEERLERKGWLKGVSRVETMPGSDHVISVHTEGPEVLEMEKMCEADVLRDISEFLSGCAGNSDIPKPIRMKRSLWSDDQYFNGSHTYLHDFSDVSLQEDLATPVPGPTDPVPPVLLFAGEATYPGQVATVLGAKMSGIREAMRISSLASSIQ